MLEEDMKAKCKEDGEYCEMNVKTFEGEEKEHICMPKECHEHEDLFERCISEKLKRDVEVDCFAGNDDMGFAGNDDMGIAGNDEMGEVDCDTAVKKCCAFAKECLDEFKDDPVSKKREENTDFCDLWNCFKAKANPGCEQEIYDRECSQVHDDWKQTPQTAIFL